MAFRNLIRPLTFVVMCLFFFSCTEDVEYKTSHPKYAAFTVEADWSDRGEGVEIPERYQYTVDGTTYIVQGDEIHDPGLMVQPGTYSFTAHNYAGNIGFSGTAIVVGMYFSLWETEGVSNFISGEPGWVFTCSYSVEMKADTDYELYLPMRQEVRELNLYLEVDGERCDELMSLNMYMGGIAGEYDFVSGVYGDSSNVEFNFSAVTEGSGAGEWMASARLLGLVDGESQVLRGAAYFMDGTVEELELEFDLTTALEGFNDDKTQPLSVDCGKLTLN